jgi:hypothetical protein
MTLCCPARTIVVSIRCTSWWWAIDTPETCRGVWRNILKIHCASSWGFFKWIYRDARPTKHKKDIIKVVLKQTWDKDLVRTCHTWDGVGLLLSAHTATKSLLVYKERHFLSRWVIVSYSSTCSFVGSDMMSSDSATFYVHFRSTSIRFSVLLSNFGLMLKFYIGKPLKIVSVL